MDENLDNTEIKDQNLYTFQLIQKLSNEVTSTNTVLGDLRTEIINLIKEKDISPLEMVTLSLKVKELNDIIIEHNKILYLNGEEAALNQLAKNATILQDLEHRVNDLRTQMTSYQLSIEQKNAMAQQLGVENSRLTRQNRLTVILAVISGLVAIITAIISSIFGKK